MEAQLVYLSMKLHFYTTVTLNVNPKGCNTQTGLSRDSQGPRARTSEGPPAPKAPENFLDHALLSLSHALLCTVKALLLNGNALLYTVEEVTYRCKHLSCPVKTQTEKDEPTSNVQKILRAVQTL